MSIKGGRAWLKVWVDGKIDDQLGVAGKVVGNGKTLTFTGKDSIEVRTGSSGVTYFTLNGTSLGALGAPGTPRHGCSHLRPHRRRPSGADEARRGR